MNVDGLIAELEAWPGERIQEMSNNVTQDRVRQAISREERGLEDLVALLSPAAESALEEMAQEAHRLTRWHFGRTISLYTPIYLSNLCAADCVYCGFSFRSGSKDKRVTLSAEHIHQECRHLLEHGFDNVLLLTGEAPKAVPVAYIADAVRIARQYFSAVAVEIYALDTEEYAVLCEAGLEGVTLYMETYDRETYAEVHLYGKKVDYEYRLAALSRAGRAGVRRLNLGALLGLSDWQTDVVHTAVHARYLQKTCWQSVLGVSFPRLLHVPERYTVKNLVTDAQLVQIILAMRLFLPETGFNLSTRERSTLRDRLIPLGITHMSAGSSTRPGGYATFGDVILEQFELEDRRSAAEVVDAIKRAGYDPVWKDFDHAFDGIDCEGS